MRQSTEIKSSDTFMGPHCYLSRVLGLPVFAGVEKIGSVRDLFTLGQGATPEITHLVCSRPFGAPDLFIPWSKLRAFETKAVYMMKEDYSPLTNPPGEGGVFLEDQVLDKKVIDLEEREIEVAYDLRLLVRNGRLYVADVDISKYGLLCRIGMRPIAQAFYRSGRLEKRSIPWSAIQSLPQAKGALGGGLRLNVLKKSIANLPPVDLADILEALEEEPRTAIFSQLDQATASDTLEQIDPNVQRDLVSVLDRSWVARLADQMTPAQAADFLSVLSLRDVNGILPLLSEEKRKKVTAILEDQHQEIINFGTNAYLRLASELSIGEALAEFRRVSKELEIVWYVYVLDSGKLKGVVSLPELVAADPMLPLREICKDKIVTLRPQHTLKQAAELFERYGHRALPIVAEEGEVLGVVPYQDIVRLKHRLID
jgi:magnesium transporter